MRVLIILVPVLCTLTANGQWSDTTRAHDIRDQARFIVNFDARRQEVLGDVVKFYGLRVGIQERWHILAIGLYGLDTPFEDRGIEVSDLRKDSLDVRTSMNYLSGTYERILLDTRKWQLSLPIMAGIGNSPLDVKDSTGVYKRFKDYRVFPLETGVRASFKVLFWLYLQGGVGYRKVLGPSPLVDKKYSGITWNYGLSIKFGKIYRYAKDKLEERRERKGSEDGTP